MARGLIPSPTVHRGVTTGTRTIPLPGVAGRLPVPCPNSRFGVERARSQGLHRGLGHHRPLHSHQVDRCLFHLFLTHCLLCWSTGGPQGYVLLQHSRGVGDFFLCSLPPLKPHYGCHFSSGCHSSSPPHWSTMRFCFSPSCAEPRLQYPLLLFARRWHHGLLLHWLASGLPFWPPPPLRRCLDSE